MRRFAAPKPQADIIVDRKFPQVGSQEHIPGFSFLPFKNRKKIIRSGIRQLQRFGPVWIKHNWIDRPGHDLEFLQWDTAAVKRFEIKLRWHPNFIHTFDYLNPKRRDTIGFEHCPQDSEFGVIRHS